MVGGASGTGGAPKSLAAAPAVSGIAFLFLNLDETHVQRVKNRTVVDGYWQKTVDAERKGTSASRLTLNSVETPA